MENRIRRILALGGQVSGKELLGEAQPKMLL